MALAGAADLGALLEEVALHLVTGFGAVAAGPRVGVMSMAHHGALPRHQANGQHAKRLAVEQCRQRLVMIGMARSLVAMFVIVFVIVCWFVMAEAMSDRLVANLGALVHDPVLMVRLLPITLIMVLAMLSRGRARRQYARRARAQNSKHFAPFHVIAPLGSIDSSEIVVDVATPFDEGKKVRSSKSRAGNAG